MLKKSKSNKYGDRLEHNVVAVAAASLFNITYLKKCFGHLCFVSSHRIDVHKTEVYNKQ